MKSTTTTPALVDPTRPVPLEVTVHADDIHELVETHDDDWVQLVNDTFTAGVVAERVAQKWGYRLVEIDHVDTCDVGLHVEGWAVAANVRGGPA